MNPPNREPDFRWKPHGRRAENTPAGKADEFFTPDLTNRIMSRLGFERITADQSGRLRRRRFLGRSITILAMVAVGVFGVYLHGLSDRARRPVDLSIPAAISNDLGRVRDGMQHLRDGLAPAPRNPHVVPLHDTRDTAPQPHDGDSSQSRVPWSGLL